MIILYKDLFSENDKIIYPKKDIRFGSLKWKAKQEINLEEPQYAPFLSLRNQTLEVEVVDGLMVIKRVIKT